LPGEKTINLKKHHNEYLCFNIDDNGSGVGYRTCSLVFLQGIGSQAYG
jgi:hypothetical protein